MKWLSRFTDEEIADFAECRRQMLGPDFKTEVEQLDELNETLNAMSHENDRLMKYKIERQGQSRRASRSSADGSKRQSAKGIDADIHRAIDQHPDFSNREIARLIHKSHNSYKHEGSIANRVDRIRPGGRKKLP